jgi:hypothetical protein
MLLTSRPRGRSPCVERVAACLLCLGSLANSGDRCLALRRPRPASYGRRGPAAIRTGSDPSVSCGGPWPRAATVRHPVFRTEARCCTSRGGKHTATSDAGIARRLSLDLGHGHVLPRLGARRAAGTPGGTETGSRPRPGTLLPPRPAPRPPSAAVPPGGEVCGGPDWGSVSDQPVVVSRPVAAAVMME